MEPNYVFSIIILANFVFQVMKIVRAIRNGWIKPKVKSDGQPKYYLIWGKDDSVNIFLSVFGYKQY